MLFVFMTLNRSTRKKNFKQPAEQLKLNTIKHKQNKNEKYIVK